MHGEKILILNPIRERFLVEKYGAKVLAKLFDSRTSYIASVTIVQRAGNAMKQIKYAKKY